MKEIKEHKIINKKHKTIKVIRNWSNGFAENCYELEDGTTIYISYNNDEITFEK